MVSYIGGAGQENFATAMWNSLGNVAAAPAVVSDVPAVDITAAAATSATAAMPAQGLPGSLAHIRRLSNRLRRRLGLGSAALIPGYNPCKQHPASRSTDGKGCSQGLICLSPLPNGPAEHESGGCCENTPAPARRRRRRRRRHRMLAVLCLPHACSHVHPHSHTDTQTCPFTHRLHAPVPS